LPSRNGAPAELVNTSASIYRDATKNSYVGRCVPLTEADPGNVYTGGAKRCVGCTAFDQRARELKA
jgi:hypothetical protein